MSTERGWRGTAVTGQCRRNCRQGVCFGVPSFQLTFLHSSPPLPTSVWGTGNGERGTGRVSKWRPHHCPRLATARSSPPRQCISGSTPSKRRRASQGRDCRCAWVMGKKGGCRESRIRPCICRENHAPTPAKTPVFSQAWGLSPPKSRKVLPPPRFCFIAAHVLHSQLLQAHHLP